MQTTDPLYLIVQTSRALLREEGQSSAVEVLVPENVDFELRDHDNWNGGTDFYEVVIRVSVRQYAKLKKNHSIEEVAKSIMEALESVNAGNSSLEFTGVVLRPVSTAVVPLNEPPILVNTSFWAPGHFKVFISHLSSEKERATRLKAALVEYGMSCFVAHEDISVTAVWHDEIINALRTMDCLIAILSDGFRASEWCDQEVGFGLGRDVLCIPIKGEVDPYGLLGKYQAMKASGKLMRQVAESIFKIVATNEKTALVYQRVISDLFLTASTKEQALSRLALLTRIPALEKDVVFGIRLHFAESVLRDDKKAISTVNTLLRKAGLDELPSKEQHLEVYSEDLPF